MRSRIGSILCVFSLLVALAGCGGSGSDGGTITPPPTTGTPPPPPPPVIGVAGGTVREASGASVIVPAGAFAAETTIRVAMDSTGAPALPDSLIATGNTYVITPHGGDFTKPVEVRIPAPNVTLEANQEIKLAKAQPNGEWEVLVDTALADGTLSAQVNNFSFFRAVTVTYKVPMAQALPMAATSTLDCAEQPCDRALFQSATTYTVVSNNGQVPADCQNTLTLVSSRGYWETPGLSVPRTGGVLRETTVQGGTDTRTFFAGVVCDRYHLRFDAASQRITWQWPVQPPVLTVVRMPAQIDVVEGLPANLDVIMGGGARGQGTITDRAVIEWQRSSDGGTSWRVIGRSYQGEGHPVPLPDVFWRAEYGFVANSTDQGALVRLHACYTSPTGTDPPCIFSVATRINVLQQSSLPTFVDAPRSMLVRTGQTASLSVNASGLPNPTLQWQTRSANSTSNWTDLMVAGANTPNYTTPAMTLADNGIQYRVLATNAVGSTASTTATVSVSDLDVAPSITTAPSSLNVASGSDAVFAVDARGTEALSYQWYRNGSALAGANSPVLRLTGVSVLNAGNFSVRVSNSAGNTESSSATLNVYSGTPAAVAPSIVTQPASLTVNVGNTATFAVGVDGSGPFTFQWRRNGISIPGATRAVLSLPSVVADASGDYSVVVSNGTGSEVSTAAELNVSSVAGAAAPAIVTQPSTVVVAPGGSAVLAVAATGSGPLSYQWSAGGVPIVGKTEAVLLLPTVGEGDAGDFTVAVSNSLGTVVSQSASVILLGAPVIKTSPTDVSVFENSTTTFRVNSTGSGRHFQWLRNGSPIAFSDADAYTTPSLTVADSGAVYSVIVYNGAGLVSSAPAVLTVRMPVAPTTLQEPADANIPAGATANICMAFGGTPPFSVQMNRWLNSQWTRTGPAHSFADNAPHCITTPVLEAADNGAQFVFAASNDEGGNVEAKTRTVTVTVAPSSAITTPTLVSRSTSGVTANNRSRLPSISADGNLVAFISEGTNLVPGATNVGHAYVRNLATGVTTLINQTTTGEQSIYGVFDLKLAAGGRYAVFSSLADDLVTDDTNSAQDVFVRDLQAGTTRRVSLRADGSQITNAGNSTGNMQVDISADGHFVSFLSTQDLIGNGPAGHLSLYLRDIPAGFLHRVVTSTDSTMIVRSALSANGEYMAYVLSTYAPIPVRDVIVSYETESGVAAELFSVDTSDNTSSVGQGVSISGNGRYIAFPVRSPALFNGSVFNQIVAIDRQNPGLITVASGGPSGFGNGNSNWPRMSDDGDVLFATFAGNLTGDFANSQISALVVRDLQSSELRVASRRPDGTTVAALTNYNYHALSRDGTAVAFSADEFAMSGGPREYQVYVAPRP